MDRRWLNVSVRALLALVLVYAIYLVTRRAIAHWYFLDPTPERIRQAIRFDPGNPMYYAALARVLEITPDGPGPEEVIRLYEKATQLSPYQARYWADLGGAYELASRSDAARAAYERARQLFPNSPDINWHLGNFYLRAGETHDALRAFQKTIVGNPKLRRQAFDLAWRATEDGQVILAEMIPPQTDIHLDYLNYLVEKQRIEAAIFTWQTFIALDLPFDLRAAFPYLDALIQHRRVEELVAAWEALAARHPTQFRRRRFVSDVINNGDFESEILNGGLGWRVQPVAGAVVSVDSLTFFDGTRALKLEFDGKQNLDYRHVLQFVPVKPNTSFRFTGYMRAQGITTDSGPRFQIYDPYDPAKFFFMTENLVGNSSWLPQQLEFKTGPQTRLLVVRLARLPSRKFDNLITGTIWVDRISLTAIE